MFKNEINNTIPRIIIATTGTIGDIYPFVTLAQHLKARQHDVHMFLPEPYADFMQTQEVAYTLFGERAVFQATLDDPDLWNEHKGFGVVWKGLSPYFGVLREIVAAQPTTRPCILFCHPLLVPLAAIAKTVRPDLKILTAYLAPSNLCSSHDFLTLGSLKIPAWLPLSWRRGVWQLVHRFSVGPAMLPLLNAFRAQYALPAVDDFFAHVLTTPDAAIGLFPTWFAAKQPDWPSPLFETDFPLLPATAPTLSPALHAFLAAGDKPIVFTPGSGHQQAASYFKIALNVLKKLGRRGLFLTYHADHLPASLPPEVMWVEHAPFDQLLPHVAALVHHGGIGTTATACRAGVPQLVIPYAFDQFDNACRVKKHGLGETILARQLTEKRLMSILNTVLTADLIHQSCKKMAAQIQADPMAHIIQQTERALEYMLIA